MTEVLQTYWIPIAAVVVALVGLALLLFRRRTHVEISRPTLEDAVASPTLARGIPAAPTIEPVIAPTPMLEPVAGAADNLGQLKGVGPKLAGLFAGLGVTRLDQIAAWTDADIAKIDEHLGVFAGRIARDQLVDQARLLASGDVAAFEARFGKLDPASGPAT